MKLIDPSIEVITKIDGSEIMKHIELAIRNCYKSEDKIKNGSADLLVKTILDSHHYSTIEHFSITARVVCSRACMAQWTRHRLFSFSIESQRFCSYNKDKFGNEITFIKPRFLDSKHNLVKGMYIRKLVEAENAYFELIDEGLKAQEARGLLPNDTKTEVVVSGNLRVWREFLAKRTVAGAQDEIKYLSKLLLAEFNKELPLIFGDL